MPNMNEMTGAVRKVLPIFYVIDRSGSMTGDKISSVNEAMRETVEVLKKISAENGNALMKIGVLAFSETANWITNHGLEDLETDFEWEDIDVQPRGITYLDLALDELNDKMSRSTFLVSETGFMTPVIIFMSDGLPSRAEWKESLQRINKENAWFTHATKIAVAIGDDAVKSVLSEVVGSDEAVINVNDLEQLKKLIKFVSIRASVLELGTRHAKSADGAQEVVKQALNEVGIDQANVNQDDDNDSSKKHKFNDVTGWK